MSATGFGVTPIETIKTMSGLAFLRGIAEGRFPRPPISGVLDFDLVEVEKGFVVFLGRPSADHFNPMGGVHGGYAATLLDSCMACAVHSAVDPGEAQTTLEIKVNMVRPITGQTGEVRAEGRLLSRGRRVGTAEGKLLDKNGKLLAHGSTTCMIFPL